MLVSILIAALASAADAPVRYETISCRNVKDAPLKQCQVALVDRGEDRVAAYVTGPDGRKRIIHFRGGVPWSTDAGSRLSYERNHDTLLVSVGRAELYEVPERLVSGE